MSEASVWFAVIAGGACGAILRGLVFRAIETGSPETTGKAWAQYGPASGTLVVNIVGSFLLGWIVAGSSAGLAEPSSEAVRAFWLTGICGALTTFSTLCADVVSLARAGEPIRGADVLTANIILGLSALAAGLLLAS